MSSPRSGFVSVDGVPTRVVTFGCWVEDADRLPDKRVIVCIPGNPGLTGFYTGFLAAVHARTGIPCWVVGHAGHEAPRRKARDTGPCDVRAQARHKAAFIEQFVPCDARVTLIGHSIGAKIVLDILKTTRVAAQLDAGYLLFPTIERMADTPNGRFLVGTVKPFVFLIVLLSWFFHVLPGVLKRLAVSLWFTLNGTSTSMAGVTVRLIQPRILRNVFHMALDEMAVVCQPDLDTLRAHAPRLRLYYGADDNWAPAQYARDIQAAVPELDVRVCTMGYGHAFVLDSAEQVGEMVAQWIAQQ